VRTRIKELRAGYDMTREDLAGKVGARRETILYHTRSFSESRAVSSLF